MFEKVQEFILRHGYDWLWDITPMGVTEGGKDILSPQAKVWWDCPDSRCPQGPVLTPPPKDALSTVWCGSCNKPMERRK